MSTRIIQVDGQKLADALVTAITGAFGGVTEFTSKTTPDETVVYSITDACGLSHVQVSKNIDPKLLTQLQFFAKGFLAAHKTPMVLA